MLNPETRPFNPGNWQRVPNEIIFENNFPRDHVLQSNPVKPIKTHKPVHLADVTQHPDLASRKNPIGKYLMIGIAGLFLLGVTIYYIRQHQKNQEEN